MTDLQTLAATSGVSTKNWSTQGQPFSVRQCEQDILAVLENMERSYNKYAMALDNKEQRGGLARAGVKAALTKVETIKDIHLGLCSQLASSPEEARAKAMGVVVRQAESVAFAVAELYERTPPIIRLETHHEQFLSSGFEPPIGVSYTPPCIEQLASLETKIDNAINAAAKPSPEKPTRVKS